MKARALRIDIAMPPAALAGRLFECLAANNMKNGVHIRLMLTRGVKRTPYQDPRVTTGPATIVIIPEYKIPEPEIAQCGLRLFTVHVRRTGPDQQDQKLKGMPASRARILYQKHMTHHMIPAFGRDWIHRMMNAFLIREPERVLAGYSQKRTQATLEDIGIPQQVEIFDAVADCLGKTPPVLNSNDILENAKGMLTALCAACDIAFSDVVVAARPSGQRWRLGRTLV
jgi:hypothetical protein